ncbi:sigma-54-dependent transcriptional regulator [Desulforudis sp. 1088]|uniref:sigma-54-dependent transcriptional regulator n=1 Tax=unclassified Candidatus Desulforudis TaxID=2635950 RepID=UPI003CE4698A
MLPKVLIIDDEEDMCWALEKAMQQEGYAATAVTRGKQGLTVLRGEGASIVLLDLQMPDMNGLDVLREIRLINPDLPVIIITGYGTIEVALEAMRRGATGYVTKPLDLYQLKLTVRKALQEKDLVKEVKFLRSELTKDREAMIGESPAINAVRYMIQKVAPTDATVLLTGESGTGKEVAAVAIHKLSLRAEGPFVAVNCAALPEQLLETELFGHEKGAFTGATARRTGRFELANHGTIFLDEIGEMPPGMQAKLLRVLQEKAFERVGGTQTLQVDIRVVAATNKNLEEAVKNGSFREDLFYRLNVIHIHIPPLRERREDIPLLVNHFLGKLCPPPANCRVTDEALELLCRYGWPGNVRELQNVLERAVILGAAGEIKPEHLPQDIQHLAEQAKEEDVPAAPTLREAEKEMIIRALRKSGGNRSQAARLLGIARTTLLFRMKKYGIN